MTTLDETLTRRIATRGRITFAEFMGLTLYWPNGGYYSGASIQDPVPDYYTSPSTHPAFGALLSLQLEEAWRLLGSPDPFVVVEPGAGSGRLAGDITRYAEHLDGSFRKALRYVAVDRAPRERSADQAVQWIEAADIPLRGVTGCILSNELLDAFPVHRVVLRKGRLQEIYVTNREGWLVEVEDEPSTPEIAARLNEEEVVLAEGQRAEVCLEFDRWMERTASALERGFLVTVDYGYPASELYSPARLAGTLRCYFKHTLSDNPYLRVGQQDMTAHVDFTAVADLGERHGLTSQPLLTQAGFLGNLGLGTFQRRLMGTGLGQSERDANRMAMLDLARPGGMGDFKVLVQGKGVDAALLTGIRGHSDAWKERLADLPLPLLDEAHISVMGARYPHAAQGWGDNWPT
jgi:SAM-dependent MidA family methyltransferase